MDFKVGGIHKEITGLISIISLVTCSFSVKRKRTKKIKATLNL